MGCVRWTTDLVRNFQSGSAARGRDSPGIASDRGGLQDEVPGIQDREGYDSEPLLSGGRHGFSVRERLFRRSSWRYFHVSEIQAYIQFLSQFWNEASAGL